jgi:signal transduction histidine kinase
VAKAERMQELFAFANASTDDSPIRPADLITESVDKAREIFPRSIDIATAYSDDLWLVKGDAVQLRRVLNNVFENARDAMPDGGSLLIWARNFIVDEQYASTTAGAHLGQYVMVRVSDTGNGKPRRMIDNVFDPFLDEKEIRPRTTLGLIKRNGGFISVYSDLGKGTTCQIFLPVWQG